MNRQIRSFAKILPGLLPLLLGSVSASAATDLPGTLVPPGGVPAPGSAPPPVQYPFASVSATEFTKATRMGHHYRAAFSQGRHYRSLVQYHVHFKLNPASDGLAPPNENVLLSAAPDPSNPQAAHLPRFQVFIPSGCFVDMSYHRARYDVDGLGCGVEVRLHDPDTTMNTSLNDYVHHFKVQLSMRHDGNQGELRLRMNFAGFNAPDSVNANGMLDFTVGNDGVTQLPMKSPRNGHGHERHGHHNHGSFMD
ncbi:MAG TPA: hypothetical protein VKA13_04970 [Gammaproteobacteria bacterium]|nr:hypothetical protein [Gammaproteobacteria bacterium]